MKGDIMTEKNKKRAMIVGTCVVAGVALVLIGKKCYDEGYTAGMISIMNKNEGKVLNF